MPRGSAGPVRPTPSPLCPGRASGDRAGTGNVPRSLLGHAGARAGPRVGSRAGCSAIQQQNTEAAGTTQATSSAEGKRRPSLKTAVEEAVSLELFVLRNSNTHSRQGRALGGGQGHGGPTAGRGRLLRPLVRNGFFKTRTAAAAAMITVLTHGDGGQRRSPAGRPE